MLIGTAGHIDHGKTALLHALTGTSADRLPEEQRRGITIELGFAYAPYREDGEERMLAFIDVPGHEKFIPTMLAGASGIDFALLVIAADDGVMPQTREHLAILDLLGVRRGAVALTKCDRVAADRIAALEVEVARLLASTTLKDAPLFAVSAHTGAGVAELRAHLQAVARAESRDVGEAGLRLVVDRRFALAGAGAVLTGTIHAGRVTVGDSVLLARPGGKTSSARVRALHVNNRPANTGSAGTRCAVNLAGIDYQDIARGDWLLSPGLVRASERIDAQLRLLPAHWHPGHKPAKLGHWTSVTLHHAGGQAMARLTLLDDALEGGGLEPGREGLVQAVLDRPLFACTGDRIIIRDAAGRQTIGGGIVLDPFPPSRHRRRPQRLAMLRAQLACEVGVRLAAIIEHCSHGIDADELALGHNLLKPRWQALLPEAVAVDHKEGTRLFSAASWEALAAHILARLEAHHHGFADEPGVERERLRRMCAPQLPSAVFLARLQGLEEEGRLQRTGSAWHLPTHVVELSPGERKLGDALIATLEDGRFDPPWVRELAASHAVDEGEVRRLLRALAMRGEAYQVVRDLFYARSTVSLMAGIVAELAGERDGRVRAADFRDRIGGGRKRAIQILEFFDRVGFTRRVGDGRQRAHVIRGEAPAGVET